MPELPEVETITKDLNQKVLNRTFIDVWTDTKKIIKKPKSFKDFKREIKGKKIKKIWRRGKNIIFELSKNYSLLIHQKLTGHLLYGKWNKKNGMWEPESNNFLKDKINTYLHLVFFLDNKKMLALSDLRKFAKVELWETEDLKKSKQLNELGPEPLEKGFTFFKFKEILKNKKGKIKQLLMDQKIIAGIGNIYSDEILWRSKIHPLKDVSKLNEEELEKIYQNIKKVLKKAIQLRGESFSDFRDLEGKKGFFDKERKVYQREGENCFQCQTKIRRIKMGGRSAYFCPFCQKV